MSSGSNAGKKHAGGWVESELSRKLTATSFAVTATEFVFASCREHRAFSLARVRVNVLQRSEYWTMFRNDDFGSDTLDLGISLPGTQYAMAPGKLLSKNLRPARMQEENEEDEVSAEEAEDSGSREEEGLSEEDGSIEGGATDNDVDTGEEDEGADQQINNVSFGALKQAQDALSRKRKRQDESNPAQEDKLEALRERLRHLKEQKGGGARPREDKPRRTSSTQKPPMDDEEDGDAASDSDSAPSEEDAPKRSKHMPAARSSRHPVTRKRQVIDVPVLKTRDPRFDALHRQASHPSKTDKAYSFLRDYQADEISQLKAALKATKDSDDKEKLKRKIGSMENRVRAKEAEERKQTVLRQHRREEKGKVEQGKTPYYLKNSELKERTLVEKYKGMKGKDREKAIEKKRKKEGQKEKRRMPEARRMAG